VENGYNGIYFQDYWSLIMSRTAKLFASGGSQAVRLPAEYRFAGKEVFIYRDGERVVRPLEEQAISVVTLAELLYGVRVSARPAQNRQALELS
jgi:virulence-associated protein VagC